MIRLSALAAIVLQVAATAALATQVLLFGGSANSNARPVDPVPIAAAPKARHPFT